jgi:hypothetical protein
MEFTELIARTVGLKTSKNSTTVPTDSIIFKILEMKGKLIKL